MRRRRSKSGRSIQSRICRRSDPRSATSTPIAVRVPTGNRTNARIGTSTDLWSPNRRLLDLIRASVASPIWHDWRYLFAPADYPVRDFHGHSPRSQAVASPSASQVLLGPDLVCLCQPSNELVVYFRLGTEPERMDDVARRDCLGP
jgi:hypothetical protein